MERIKELNIAQKINQFKEFQEKIGIHFANEKLLKQAFTHSSYVNEHRESHYEDNERLRIFRRCGS